MRTAASPQHQSQRGSTPEWANDFTRYESVGAPAAIDQQHSRNTSRNDTRYRQQQPQRQNPNLISQSRLFNATGINGGSFANDMMMRGQDLNLRQNQHSSSGHQGVVQSAQGSSLLSDFDFIRSNRHVVYGQIGRQPSCHRKQRNQSSTL
jgi:hypothetical protein